MDVTAYTEAPILSTLLPAEFDGGLFGLYRGVHTYISCIKLYSKEFFRVFSYKQTCFWPLLEQCVERWSLRNIHWSQSTRRLWNHSDVGRKDVGGRLVEGRNSLCNDQWHGRNSLSSFR
jgi:hypothetical protein